MATYLFVFRLPKWLSGKESTCNAGDVGSIPESGRFAGGGHGTPVFLPGESHGQRSLAGYSPQGCEELDMTEATEHTHFFIFWLHWVLVETCGIFRCSAWAQLPRSTWDPSSQIRSRTPAS